MKLASLESVLLFPRISAFRTHYRCALTALLCLAPLSASLAGTLYIGGVPKTKVTAPTNYVFRPWIAGADQASAKWSIKNKPYWATFNVDTGALSGKVYAPNIGTYSNITISASSATARARMASFSIVVTRAGTTQPPPTPPTITGNPATTVSVGNAFSFQPTSADPADRKLTFSVNTKPAWTSFDSGTGRLFGTPTAANVGTVSNIIISANDGVASASLEAFSLTVVQNGNGAATVNWTPPTTDINGRVLKNLGGYLLEYGTNRNNLTNSIQLTNPGMTSYVITGLTPATYYFGVAAVTTNGAQSQLSALASKTIP